MIIAKPRSGETSEGLCSSLLLKAGSAPSSDLVTQDFTQAGLANYQGCIRHNHSGQPAPQHGEKLFLQHTLDLSSFHFIPMTPHSPTTVNSLAPRSPSPPHRGCHSASMSRCCHLLPWSLGPQLRSAGAVLSPLRVTRAGTPSPTLQL